MDQATRSNLADFINDHRLAVGREPLCTELFTDDELAHHDALIMANAPFGNDPWADGAAQPG